jgi:hypothetical protein
MTDQSFAAKSLLGLAIALGVALPALADENASNPLSKGRNTDLRVQATQGSAQDKTDAFIDGAFMASDNLKIKYELHYNDISRDGESLNGLEIGQIKAIYFPKEGALSDDWGYRLAVGADWIVDMDHGDGIGPEADQLGPFFGVAFGSKKTGVTVIPLIQQYISYNGINDISTTAARLIVLRPFAEKFWAKADVKVPYDWENETWPLTAELQIGYNINQRFAIYGDLLAGIGNDRPYDAGVGLGLRFRY